MHRVASSWLPVVKSRAVEYKSLILGETRHANDLRLAATMHDNCSTTSPNFYLRLFTIAGRHWQDRSAPSPRTIRASALLLLVLNLILLDHFYSYLFQ